VAERPSRKLAVILHADVVDSTALVRSDESLAHERIRDAFKRFSSIIEKYNGVAHELRGDALVAEFARASDAICAGLAFQDANAAHNETLSGDIRPESRVGISLGEVVIADETITGTGVVLAQRLEQLAKPGGVVVQGAVSEAVPDRLPFEYQSLGEQKLKGFDDPVRAFAVRLKPNEMVPSPEVEPSPPHDGEMPAAHEKRPTADIPTIAVLPFTNMSGDLEQQYFSDGITEDIITELSRSHILLVISRNSSFQYRGQSTDVTAVGRELGASYIVEGSVRKAGNRVRVTGQLIEAAGGNHLWAERYDRELDGIFEIQDDVVQSITIAVLGRLSREVASRVARKPPRSLTAYELVLRGAWLLRRNLADQSALYMFNRAIELDPNFTRAHVYAAQFHAYSAFALAVPPEQAIEQALSYIERALGIDDLDPAADAVAALAYILMGDHALARQHIDRATAISPNNVDTVRAAGIVEGYLGNHETARDWYEKFKRLDPQFGDASREGIFDHLFMTRRYMEATRVFDGWRSPPWHMYAELAAAHGHLDRTAESAKAKARAEEMCPGDAMLQILRKHVAMCARESDAQNWLAGYRKAGFDL